MKDQKKCVNKVIFRPKDKEKGKNEMLRCKIFIQGRRKNIYFIHRLIFHQKRHLWDYRFKVTGADPPYV